MKRKSLFRGATILSTLAAAGLILTGCSGGGSAGSLGNATKANLVMTIWGSTTDTKTYQERADAYTKTHPDVKVTVRNIPTANYEQEVDTMISGGDSPDIILVDGSSGPDLASRGGIIDLSPDIKKSNLNLTANVSAGRLTGYQLNGKQFALPDRGGNIVFYYNKSMFDAAGLPYPTDGWTWDQMVADAKKLTITKNGKTTQWGVAVDDWPNAITSVMTSFGGTFVNAAGTKETIDSAAFRNGLQQYGDLSLTLKVSPTLTDYANFGQNVNRDALFNEGKTAMIWAGMWDVPDFVKAKLNFGVVAPPIAKAGAPTMEAFGTGLAVGAKSKNQAAAWNVVKYMFSAAGQKPIVTNQEDVPSANSLLTAYEQSLPGDVSYDAIIQAGDNVFSPTSPPQINQINTQVQKDLDPYFAGKTTVAAATSLAATHITQILKQK